ncbi:MAG: hypothetical protein JEZ01_00475 [Labilibaculum sp.]|nr:hypothetical protein [Labilibaculum sp.]MBI9056221.1 hypothetical protein [Labilibaculum sp.]|eukprot:TRINITY_DN3986_c0_g4_i1.p1 TRINITY_DN3986_c0_g4~~TRINITY_DN3986_c0_g4_i1.p1  ORF type:complete len:147 (+),score=31.97 TRINITY_DN3986_c0_g4_i1:129-569(+)
MDGDWGNIIYLIAVVLFGIISMLKKKKPPVAVAPPEDGEVEQQEFEPKEGLESVLEAFLGGAIPKSQVQAVEEPEPVRQESMMEEYNRREREKAEERVETKKSTFGGLDSISIDRIDEIEEEEVESEEIDWRQAIIYKEILDRKYN